MACVHRAAAQRAQRFHGGDEEDHCAGTSVSGPQQKVLQIWVTYCLGPEPEVQTWEGDPNLEDLRAHCVSLVF